VGDEKIDQAIHELTIKVVELISMLRERCPQHSKEIEHNFKDINAAFSRIRKLEKFQAALLAIAAIIAPILTTLLNKYVVK